MKISTEFSKYAQNYDTCNYVQKKVVKTLLEKVFTKPKFILDLGCGSGLIYKNIDWSIEKFTAIDFALGMLELHPKSPHVELINANFNNSSLFQELLKHRFDYIVSASALQWADDLDFVFENIKKLNAPIALAIFTSNTFKTLNKTAGIKSLLNSKEEIQQLQKKYFNAKFEVFNYKLEFDSVREMFKYIKQSGVSGSRKILSYKQTKKLMQDYPLNYLEFEVAFIYSDLK